MPTTRYHTNADLVFENLGENRLQNKICYISDLPCVHILRVHGMVRLPFWRGSCYSHVKVTLPSLGKHVNHVAADDSCGSCSGVRGAVMDIVEVPKCSMSHTANTPCVIIDLAEHMFELYWRSHHLEVKLQSQSLLTFIEHRVHRLYDSGR